LKINLGAGLDLIPYLAENIPDCDVNVATWYPTAFAVYFSGRGRPYYFVQDFPAMVAEQCDFCSDYCLRMFEASLRLPFYFLTNSTYTRDLVIKCQPDAKIKVIGVGVDDKIFYPRKKKLLENVKKPKVMVIIRGFRFKGDEVAVKVLNALNKKLPIHALLVGSHQSVWKVFSSIKPEFTYSCLEDVDDEKLAALYSSANLFLYTSYVESFGLPPLEAMACGTPVVTTDCLGNRDYAVNSYNCLLAPPEDVEELTNASLRVLTSSNLVERLIRGGLETAKQFTWDKVVERVEEHFISVLSSY
jgi:glycosyltransferase involved in cell wall biosynthesis